ncbi:uncharacterized protein LOC141612918 isoform X2 [Silene latifolia]|uniref:uncharacterized protein LOC141612918 isoform X2 n=1 Tax=Silene latifolia TaxID=37657 RepID=UPI003D785389
MGSERYVRDTCRQNCFSKHWKKHGEPPKVCAFSKSMIGNGFDISMVIPPKFSKKLKSLVGEKFTLEDSSGRRWDVLLTRTEGSLAFVTGWLNFVLDHDIQYGDLLVFYYLNDRRFLVEIYGKNACTKIFSSERIDTNRTTKTTRNSIPRKRSNDPLREESARKRHFHSSFSGPNIDVTPSPKNVHNEKEPVSENLEELFFMTRRDTNFVEEDGRDHLFDLSEFETPVKKPTIMEEKERDYLLDPVGFCLPESDKFQNAGTEAGHVDLHKCLVPERKTQVLSEYTEADFLVHECTPYSSNSPNDSVPLETIKRQQTIHKSENLNLSASPGLKMRQIHQETRVFKQEVFCNVMADNSVGAGDSPSEQSYKNQNPGETLIHTMKVEGGSSRPIKQEARELKPDISGGPRSGCLDANFFVREQTMINYVGKFVKAEPLDCVYPSEIACPIPVPVPPCSEDFLDLP